MNGSVNGSVYSPKYNLYNMIKYNGKKYMIVEVDTTNERYGLTEFNPMYVDSHSVDQSAMIMTGGKTKYKNKSRKTRRIKRRYYF